MAQREASVKDRLCGPTSANTIVELGGKIYATDFQNKVDAFNPVSDAEGGEDGSALRDQITFV